MASTSKRWGMGFWLALAACVNSHAQSTQTDLDESRALRLFDVQTAFAAWVEAGPELSLPRLQSVDLNLAKADELLNIPGATPAGVAAILAYRLAYGPFSELSELNAVDGLSTQQARLLVPFLTVKAAPTRLPSLSQAFGQQARPWLLLRTQSAWPRTSAYSQPDFATGPGRYIGDPYAVLARIRGNIPQRLSYGLVLEKDAGEAIIPNPGGGPRVDYFSAHILLRNQGKLKVLALGDYQLALGQGLLFGRSFVLGRGTEPVLTLAQTSPGILAYNALVEGRALRGSAATYAVLPGLEVTAFASAKRVDAVSVQVPDSLAAASADAVGPPRYIGLHRTDREISTRQALPEYMGGASIQYTPNQGFGHIGGVIARQVYGRPLTEVALRPGLAQAQTYGSAWYRSRIKGMVLYGEIALREGVAPSFVQALQAYPAANTGLGIQIRHLPAGSQGSYGQPIAQSQATTGGEQGIYMAATQRLRRWSLALYQDFYQQVSPTSSNPLPNPQAEGALQGIYTPNKQTEALLQVRARRQLYSTQFAPESDNLLAAGTGLQGVAGIRFQTQPWLTLSTQVRISSFPGTIVDPTRKTGWAGYQQAQVLVGPIRLTLRAYVYEADTYLARLYFYEPGVLYQPKAFLAYGRGTRLMALVNCKLPRAGNLYLKIARTQPTLADPSTEVTLQARFWLTRHPQAEAE